MKRIFGRGCLIGVACAFLWGALLLENPARAATPSADALLGRVLACRTVRGDRARLRCFDRASAALAQHGTLAHLRHEPVLQSPKETFGLAPAAIVAREVASGERAKPISNITARLTSLGTDPAGRVIYHLQNGQVWRELEADGNAPPVHIGDQLTISRGWLGSYWMQTPSGRGCKVERIH